ncbi:MULTISPECIES: GNAT family N-acetyltransferase [Pseudomonas]|uniref:N-acetyltransferase domain-containing protein n=1 Tax=Pseudomonas cerasi TaxID=1583341 RepID=A0A193SHH8_9PSED|nr:MULTISPECIES: GNAT family N-acetyltransferase [Pseudomonas]POC98491.1 hypothetical protein BKM22_26115 [Pseudomonas amygdali pv. morsprunorum]POD38329.1 hypothetical protein BKM16_26030 [Pseudomonas amygdali pv. morsprunorum]POD40264.1 hypothetical protein BKM02_26170 [Pseudomonas amygdali pv. morsprunorum]POY47882.1 N-acetyltransferase [Pseudomonas amygdali pv. morsprunorum]CZT26393.1 hypothetical protein PCPL58_p5040 [Pseudomonas cerasi]
MSTSTARQTEALELTAPEKLNDLHDLSEFDCKEPSITDYLQKKARKAQADRHAVVYVSCRKGTLVVMAYYTLSSGSVNRENVVPKSHQRNSPAEHPITLLGRMGVSEAAQGQGFSLDLLKDAIERAMTAAQSVASSAIVVHPLNDRLAEFYAKHAGFVPCPALSPVTMMLPLR